MDVVKKSQQGAGVAVKIEHAVYESAKLFGRHFNGEHLKEKVMSERRAEKKTDEYGLRFLTLIQQNTTSWCRLFHGKVLMR